MKDPVRIIFMGTPDFSVPALNALAGRDDFQIVLVVTQPDRPRGRGKKMAFSPVKAAALDLGLKVFQPERLNGPENEVLLASLKPDFFVVAAYGQILSQKILDIPKMYPINIHASLLPRYRGASPIQAAVRNMDTTSGVTTMVMARAMDAGDILLKEETRLTPQDTAEDLHDRLSTLGAGLILETIDQVLEGGLKPVPQDHSRATYVPLLKKSDGHIDWSRTAQEIRAHIHAMTPWPGAFTFLDKKRMKIFRAEIDAENSEPGTLYRISDRGIHVGTGHGTVIIRELMGPSGKRLFADQFLRGHKIDLPGRFTAE